MADDGLEPLITECPGCHTRFRVVEAQLQRAGGKVRCGACLTVFHGITHLTFESAQTYASEEQAQQALDALLDELAGPDGGDAPSSNAVPADVTSGDVVSGDAMPGDGGSSDARPSDAAAADTACAAQETVARTPPPPAPRRRPRSPIFSGFEEPDEPAPRPDEAARPGHRFQVVGGRVDDAVPGPETATAPTAVASQLPARVALPREAGRAVVRIGDRARQWLTTLRQRSDGDAPAATADDSAETSDRVVFGEVQARRPLVWLGIGLGLLLLVAQVLWYQFDDWAKQPRWQVVYGPLCGLFGCELPQQRDRSLLSTRNLAVRSHPDRPATLLVHAVIVNQAEFAQPFPVLELRFTTVRGMLVAGRRFEPDEYLAGDARGMALIPPRTPVQVELTIDDPGPEAVNYFLQFR